MNSEQSGAAEYSQPYVLIDQGMHLRHFAHSEDSQVSYAAISEIYDILETVLSSGNSSACADVAQGLNELLINHMDNSQVSGYLSALS